MRDRNRARDPETAVRPGFRALADLVEVPVRSPSTMAWCRFAAAGGEPTVLPSSFSAIR